MLHVTTSDVVVGKFWFSAESRSSQHICSKQELDSYSASEQLLYNGLAVLQTSIFTREWMVHSTLAQTVCWPMAIVAGLWPHCGPAMLT